MSKGKSSKAKPKIDPRVLTRPRLDALFERRARGELNDDELHDGIQTLMREVGEQPVWDALVKRMEGTPEAERGTLLMILPRLKSRTAIDYLWRQVKKPRVLSLDAKMTALTILAQMGEKVDLDDPSKYFSMRDIKPGDIQRAEDLFRFGLRGIARNLRGARNPAEVEALMQATNKMHADSLDGTGIYMELVKQAEVGGTDLEADFLYALAHTTPFPEVHQAATYALNRLAAAGVKPVTRAILDLGQERFYAAYMTDPEHPWQQGVTVGWERGGVIQSLVFLLDFGVPWRGAIKDMFPTDGMTPQEFQREIVERSEEEMGIRMYRIRLERAQAAIAAAVEANKANNVSLPKEFTEFRHLVERWVLHPPAAAIAADTTKDELAHLPLKPDRSGKPLVMKLRDLKHLAGKDEERKDEKEWEDEEEWEDEWEDEFDRLTDFRDVVEHVNQIYADLESSSPWWKPKWVTDYLASLSQNVDDLERGDEEFDYITDEWWILSTFIEYLDTRAYEIHSIADLRGFHVSEFVADEASIDDDGGYSRIETLRDFFSYLTKRDLIPSDHPLLAGLDQILVKADALTPLPRPAPRGGEIAVYPDLFADESRNQPFTYNEWWMALALERKFNGNLERCRAAARQNPDAAAKLALLDRLASRLKEDAEYLTRLADMRAPTADDYTRAENWFEREKVSEERAW